MKVRCPICNGTGGVEPCFGTGMVLDPRGNGYTAGGSSKPCPGCGGTGMQEVCNYPYQENKYESNEWTATTLFNGGE